MQTYQLLCQQTLMIPLSIRMLQLHARRLYLCRGAMHVPSAIYPINHIYAAFVRAFDLLWTTMDKRGLTFTWSRFQQKLSKAASSICFIGIAAAVIDLLVLTIEAHRLIQLIPLYLSFYNEGEEGLGFPCVNPF